MSLGWQFSSRQMASSVEKRIALALPFLRMERLAGVISTRSASSPSDIFRFAIMTSMLMIIAMSCVPPPCVYCISTIFFCFCGVVCGFVLFLVLLVFVCFFGLFWLLFAVSGKIIFSPVCVHRLSFVSNAFAQLSAFVRIHIFYNNNHLFMDDSSI